MIFPLVYIRDDVDNSDSTKLEDEKISSLHAQTAVPVSPTTIAEDATVPFLQGKRESRDRTSRVTKSETLLWTWQRYINKHSKTKQQLY